MGAVTRPGRRIKYRVGVVSLTAPLYNSNLPQFANPTVVNPKASSTKQMGKGGPWPGFASRTLPSKRKEGRDRARERADTNPSGYDGRDRQTLPPSATSLTPSAKGGKRRKSRTRNTAARARSGGLHLTRRRDITAGRAKKQDRQASGMYMEWGYP